MNKIKRFGIFFIYLLLSVSVFTFLCFYVLKLQLFNVLTDIIFLITLALFLISIQEMYHWAKIGRRSEMSDLIAIALFFFTILFFTKDVMTSMFGAFSIYLWFGALEIRDYPVINKILIISLVTYNVIFIAGLVSFYLEDPFYINTAFSFSFWIILGLGFLLFGRKYIVVWRFMSPAYLTLFLYVIAWLAVVFVNQYTPIKFKEFKLLDFNYGKYTPLDFILNIYFILIIVNWVVYFVSGPILDKMLGIKEVKEENLLSLVTNVKHNLGIKRKVKVGFGRYPILNAMAYGSIFDNRIAIIAEDKSQIPEDELKGIVAHELSHVKGKHTLILTVISSGDLVIRMLLGLPATYYDYTFGKPQIPMISFIFLNFAIYIVLYLFVRLLEGRADLMAKKAGYSHELAKALYNLESFYATGREIGLNTMLLCEEKINKNNQLLDYMDTASYLYKSMIQPSRGSLLSNLMNSHPPTYYRLAALLGDELKPGKEALLPFICLKRSKQKLYANKFEKSRELFKILANEKFKELFAVKDVSFLLENLGKQELFKYEINQEFIFKNKITGGLIVGNLRKVQFFDDICDSDQYVVSDLKSKQEYILSYLLYSKKLINLNEMYFFEKDNPLMLVDYELHENRQDGKLIFEDKNKNKVLKPINKTKLPRSIGIVKKLEVQEVFLKLKEKMNLYKCDKIILKENYNDCELELHNLNEIEDPNQKSLRLRLGEIIIRPKLIYIFISRTLNFRDSELMLIRWLLKNQVRARIQLKKPVNNLEVGYVQKLNFDEEGLNNDENEDFKKNNSIEIKNIFGKNITIPYKSLELISFEYNSAIILKKSDTSSFSKLAYKVSKRFNPEKIIM